MLVKYKSNKAGDWIILDDKSYKVQRRYYHDADSSGHVILEEMFDRLGNRRTGMTIFTIGDVRFVLGSFPYEDSNEHVVQFSEVRTDDVGIKFSKPIPFLKGIGQVPMIAIIGAMGEAQINIAVGNDGMGCVAKLVQQSISHALSESNTETDT